MTTTTQKRVLIACEFSGKVRDAFARLGWDAWSCDLLPSDTKGNHVQGDVSLLLNSKWDLLIAFPPCTHLATSGAAWFEEKRKDGRQQEGIDFFMKFTQLDHIPHVAIENPIGIMSSVWRKPDQIIQPYEYGEDACKRTCLWLKNLPPLIPTKRIAGRKVTTPSGKVVERWGNQCSNYGHDKTSPSPDRWKIRSVTYSGIADAMALQWSEFFNMTTTQQGNQLEFGFIQEMYPSLGM